MVVLLILNQRHFVSVGPGYVLVDVLGYRATTPGSRGPDRFSDQTGLLYSASSRPLHFRHIAVCAPCALANRDRGRRPVGLLNQVLARVFFYDLAQLASHQL